MTRSDVEFHGRSGAGWQWRGRRATGAQLGCRRHEPPPAGRTGGIQPPAQHPGRPRVEGTEAAKLSWRKPRVEDCRLTAATRERIGLCPLPTAAPPAFVVERVVAQLAARHNTAAAQGPAGHRRNPPLADRPPTHVTITPRGRRSKRRPEWGQETPLPPGSLGWRAPCSTA